MNQALLAQAYQYCKEYTQKHTEHFPVASLLLPKDLRRSITVIYTFARQADNIVDENDLSQEERFRQLEHYRAMLLQIMPSTLLHTAYTAPSNLVFIALQDLMQHYPALDAQLFLDLLNAFKQDIYQKNYQNQEDIFNYCKHSANPVGRLLLYLNHQAKTDTLKSSDIICTALQRINFLNDIYTDHLERDRCYMPLDALQKLGLSVETLYTKNPPNTVTAFLHGQLDEIESFLKTGSSLGIQLPGRFGFYIEMIIQSAYQMIHKLRLRNSLTQRLHFGFMDWVLIFQRSVVQRFKAW